MTFITVIMFLGGRQEAARYAHLQGYRLQLSVHEKVVE